MPWPYAKVILQVSQWLCLLFNMWIAVRVAFDWYGWIGSALSIILTPITVIVMPIAMFFIPSNAAGPLAMWPALIFLAVLQSIVYKISR